MPKVSVIIPVYSVEKYIERCVRSLFEQTLQDLEFIFVDDASPDDSVNRLKNVLEEYPQRKEQVKILSLAVNGGQGNARTIGMKEAQGEYVIHCDSDDWVEPDMYDTMYQTAIRQGADIVLCDWTFEYPGHKVVVRHLPAYDENPQKVIADSYLYVLNGSLVNKLVKRSLYVEHDIYPFPVKMAEDYGVVCRLLTHAKKLVQLRNPFYHYEQGNGNSITLTKTSDEIVGQMLDVSCRLRDYLLRTDKEKYAICAHFICYSSRLHLIRGKWSDLKRFKETFPETDKYVSYFSSQAFPKKARLRFWLVKYKMAWMSIILYRLFAFIKKLDHEI